MDFKEDFLQSLHRGLTGYIQFDQQARRSDFALDIYELTENGIVDVAKWNGSHGLFINRTSQELLESEDVGLANKTFIVMICIVSSIKTDLL